MAEDNDPPTYRLEMRLDSNASYRLRKVEEWCSKTHKCLLEVEEVKQISDDPGETYLVIRTWKGRFGEERTEYEVGPMYEKGDFYSEVDPVWCRNSIRLKAEGKNDLRVTCKFTMVR